LPKKDAFPPHGLESIVIRLPDATRLIGVINGPKFIGAYEFELKKGEVINCRGIAVAIATRRTIYPSRSFVNTTAPDKMNIFTYTTQLELILSLMDSKEANIIVPAGMTYHASEDKPSCFQIEVDSSNFTMVEDMLKRCSPRVFELSLEGLPYYPSQYMARSSWIGERAPIQPLPNYHRPNPIVHKVVKKDFFLNSLIDLPEEVWTEQPPPHGPKMTPEIVHGHMENLGFIRPKDGRQMIPNKIRRDRKIPNTISLQEDDYRWTSTAVITPLTPIGKEALEAQQDDPDLDYTIINYNTCSDIEVNEYPLPPSIFPSFMTRLFTYEPERFILNTSKQLTLAHFGTHYWPKKMPAPKYVVTNSQLEDVRYSYSEDQIIRMNDNLVSLLFDFMWELKKHFEKDRSFRGDLPELLFKSVDPSSSSSSSSSARPRDDTDLGRLQLVLDPDTLDRLNMPIPFLAGHHRDLTSWDFCPLWNRIVGSWARDCESNHSRILWNDKFKVFLIRNEEGRFPSRPCWAVAKENRGRTATQHQQQIMDDQTSPYQQSQSMNRRPGPSADCHKGPSNVAIQRPFNPQSSSGSQRRTSPPPQHHYFCAPPQSPRNPDHGYQYHDQSPERDHSRRGDDHRDSRGFWPYNNDDRRDSQRNQSPDNQRR
jgi:hypothetical protein